MTHKAIPPITKASSLLGFSPGVDDPATAIFDRALLTIRDRVPALAHRTRCEPEIEFGDLLAEIREIIEINEIRLHDE